MAASRALTKKKDMLSELAFSGRHAKQSLWVLVRKYNTVCKDLREQTKWVALFHCKDRFSFVDVLVENDVVPCELRTSIRTRLAECKMPSFCWRQTNQQLISYASLHSKQQMEAIFVGVVCAQLVATTIALSVFFTESCSILESDTTTTCLFRYLQSCLRTKL